jgi:hypothetical protein
MFRRKTDNRRNGLDSKQNKGECCSNTVHTSAFDPNVAVTLHRHSLVWTRLKILRHAKNPYSMKEILVVKIHEHFSPSFPVCYWVSVLVTARVLWWVTQELFELRWGSTIDPNVVAVYGTPSAIPPHEQ